MLPFDGHNQRLIRVFFSKNVMRDPVILQAALSHAAVHIDVVNGREPSKLTVVLTKEAIRLINERLAAKPFVVDNELIGAVAMIAANSVSFSSTAKLNMLIMFAKEPHRRFIRVTNPHECVKRNGQNERRERKCWR